MYSLLDILQKKVYIIDPFQYSSILNLKPIPCLVYGNKMDIWNIKTPQTFSILHDSIYIIQVLYILPHYIILIFTS